MSEIANELTIYGARFLDDFRALARFGATPDGLNREAGGDAFFEARAFLETRMKDCGLRTRVDAAGNLFGVWEGKATPGQSGRNKRKILSGSHLDSVRNGGVYDGPLGIVSALEAVRSLMDAGFENRHTLEVAAFNAEEGGPLGGTFGSRVFAGVLQPGDVAEDVLAAYGMNMDDLLAARCDPAGYAASVELHIEQGPVLWKEGIAVGVPTGIVGIARHRVRFTGAANHAGTTPMRDRRDALQAAVSVLGEWYAYANGKANFVCNVGAMSVAPGSVTVVPGEVEFLLEIRSLDLEIMREAARTFSAMAERERGGCGVEIAQVIEKPPVDLDARVAEAVCDVCRGMGISFLRMPSGASHDSSPIARVMPAGMIFVPSVEGVSHAKEEYTPEPDMLRGVACLAGTIMRLDRR